jgi:DNA (cytosine-5)-methyltransferase 1
MHASDAPPRRYRVVSLFSGAMGLDLGLERTGQFEVVACVEVERAFCETIRVNQAKGRLSPKLIVLERDIASLSVEEFLKETKLRPGDIDLLVGGPPCQSFSTAGKRRSIQDHRGTLLWHFLRFIDGLRPKFFLMENVRGLLSAALSHRPIAQRPEKGGPALRPDETSGSVVRAFADDLQKIAGSPYHMDCFEVNAVNYGAPQLRERALFIGNRFNIEVDFPAPTHGPVRDAVETPPDLFQAGTQAGTPQTPWRTLRDAIGGLNDPGLEIMVLTGAACRWSYKKSRWEAPGMRRVEGQAGGGAFLLICPARRWSQCRTTQVLHCVTQQNFARSQSRSICGFKNFLMIGTYAGGLPRSMHRSEMQFQ